MSAASFEAYCPNCEVSHPPATRVCIHCGGRVVHARPEEAAIRMRGESAGGPPPDLKHDGTPFDLRDSEGTPHESEDDEAVDVVRRKGSGPLRFAISMLWIAVFIGASIYRSCVPGE